MYFVPDSMQRALYDTCYTMDQFNPNNSATRWAPLISSRKLRLRKIKQCAEDHIDSRWKIWDLNLRF